MNLLFEAHQFLLNSETVQQCFDDVMVECLFAKLFGPPPDLLVCFFKMTLETSPKFLNWLEAA